MWYWRHHCFSLSRDLAGPQGQSVKRLYGWEPIKLNYHPTQSGGHKHSGSGDTIVFVCHVTLEDHVIKASHDFMGRSVSIKSPFY